jgi:D-3-phosphoglycerate dehydrogenase
VIVLLETVHPDAHALLSSVDEVVLVREPPVLDPGLLGPGVRALVTRGLGSVTVETISRFPDLAVVGRCGAGLDNIDTDAAAAGGVAVVHAPGVTAGAVAEHALMLMLALARRLGELDRAVKSGDWSIRGAYEGVEMRGKRLGVIGLGAIGTRIAALGAALGMDVVATSRREHAGEIARLPLDELLATSDVVQICVPLTDETAGLIGGDRLAAIKPGAMIVNTARGPIVDHVALAGALAAGRLGGYAADVWDPEPPGVGDDALQDPRTLVTPHVAALTDVTYREICIRTADAVAAVLTGRDPDPGSVFIRPTRS